MMAKLRYLRRKVPNRNWRRVIYIIIGCLIYSVIAVIVMGFVMDHSYLDSTIQLVSLLPSQKVNYYIEIDLSVQQQDLEKRMIKYHVTCRPNGAEVGHTPQYWDRDIIFEFYSSQFKVKQGNTILAYNFEVDLLEGSSKDYPFDRYYTELAFYAMDNTTKMAIPVLVETSVRTISTQTKFHPVFLANARGEDVHYHSVEVYRSATVFVLCFFVSLLTWVLSIFMLNLAYDAVVHQREHPAPVMGLGIAILFAMPALRLIQPSIPSIGCAIDYLCFFWCETLVALSSCVIIGRYALRWTPPCQSEVANYPCISGY